MTIKAFLFYSILLKKLLALPYMQGLLLATVFTFHNNRCSHRNRLVSVLLSCTRLSLGHK